MPAKEKITYICSSCGHQTPRWQGKCPNCGEWNTLAEQRVLSATAGTTRKTDNLIVSLSKVSDADTRRISSNINELDLVLGGGIVPGSLILLGGDPGIGKSTLALQAAIKLVENQVQVLYVAGEESPRQIKLRASRLSELTELLILPETNLEIIIQTISNAKPNIVVIDSIQTIYSDSINGVTGGVSQLSYTVNQLMKVAKHNNIAIFLIGHVTKEGMLAGPKTVEHMVDTVLYLEGDRFASLRLLRSSKNRFGSAGEVGVFEMQETGLVEIANASSLFLEHRDKPVAGSCTTAVVEGNKALLVEVQALTNPSSFGYPKRTASGFDLNRLNLIIAILQKSLKIDLSNQDVFVNVTGGFKIEERAADLPIALAIISSYKNKPLKDGLVAFGELGLLGEVRAVSEVEKRIKECQKLGFEQILAGGGASKSKAKGNKANGAFYIGQIMQGLSWLP